MKILSFSLLLTTMMLACQQPTANNASNTEGGQKQLRHVVLFKFKDSASTADIQKVEAAFRELPSKIKEIKSFEWGTNNSPEGLANGFTHCFFLTFDSEADRAVYLPHPDHKAFGAVLTPHLDKVLVLDYWAEH
jgi:Stress responsive A/B Barrel Domain